MKLFAVSDYTTHEGYFFNTLESAVDYAKQYDNQTAVEIVEMDLNGHMYEEVGRYDTKGNELVE